MAATKGNAFWKMRSSHGRKPQFESPDALFQAAQEYFEWVDANPLQEEKVFQHKGRIVRTHLGKMRPYTIGGLCLFLDINPTTFANYEARQDFVTVCAQIRTIIYEQKFAAATADLMNPAIIARDLGLKDKVQVEEDSEVKKDRSKRRSRLRELLGSHREESTKE